MRAMEAEAKTNPQIAARVKVFRYRTVEELYDLQHDPDCRHNLVGTESHQETLDRMRSQLHSWMQTTHDPLLRAFEKRESPEKMEDIMMEDYAPYRSKKRSAKAKKDSKKKSKKKSKGVSSEDS